MIPRIPRVFLLFFCLISLSAQAAVRPGAARAFRLEWPAANPAGSALRPAWRADKNGGQLLFTREADGARNIWQAVPSDEAEPGWLATPLTAFAAPLWADEAVPSRDGGSVFCITNAVGNPAPGDFNQIARCDWKTRRLTALTGEAARHSGLALSPDGTRLAFTREVGGAVSVFVMPAAGGAALRIVDGAKSPCWLDDNSLLVSAARLGSDGLFKVTLGEKPGAALLLKRGGAATVCNGQICLAPQGKSSDARLVLFAADGSGERAMPGTEGARAPRYVAELKGLLFDAPLSVGGARTLWILPLHQAAPVAQILAARPLAGGVVEILGTALSSETAPPRLVLEFGKGAEPEKWEPLTALPAPVDSGRLALWLPPAKATGEWTLRLTVTAANGETAQATLTVTLPLKEGEPAGSPPAQASLTVTPGGVGGNAPLRTVPGPVELFPPPKTAPVTVPIAPLPPLPPPPDEVGPPDVLGGAPVRSENSLPPLPTAKPRTERRVAPAHHAKLHQPGPKGGAVNVRGTPAVLQPGESADVRVWLRNLSRAPWPAGGEAPARLVVIWFDADSGLRRKYSITWLRGDIAPRQAATMDAAIVAPSRAGRYRVAYLVIRLPGGKMPTPDQPLTGVLAKSAFEVTVR